MALITLGSLGHSPGTTTLTVGLAMHWPRTAVLIEADIATTSSILAGRFRGQVAHRVGLTNLASASMHGELDAPMVWANSLELAPDRRVVPGFSTLGAARGAAAFWGDLLPVLTAFDAAGTDVLVDLGRCDAHDPRATLITAAELALVVMGTALPDVAATTAPTATTSTRIGDLAAALDDVGHSAALRLVLVERAAENYSAGEIRRAAGAPVAGTVPYAPGAASVYSLGAPATTGPRRERAALERAFSSIAHDVANAASGQRDRLTTSQARSSAVTGSGASDRAAAGSREGASDR
ncbi:MAG: hypothetical protein ACTH31_14210 [Pseudoclavibacter sp.]